ncbi:phage tail protein [Bradyrhizobium macuxiense]|uniref:Phage tail protein n=1 Tax=Bradyrhizobium macuxiense TaxID=1755647 RepID=A0A109JCC8_9BRAD|nr:phage tail protein [Bradyrhizobium macuxiense]
MISWNFPPRGWAFCNGQLMSLNQNQALFAVIGTTYGGNGQTNFALPDLRSRVPIHQGQGFVAGNMAGEENHTLILNELPKHTHVGQGTTTTADQNTPVGNMLANANFQLYTTQASNLTAVDPGTITNTGGNQPHSNIQPYLALNFIIALQGVFPSRT